MNENSPNCAVCPISIKKRSCKNENGLAPSSCPTVLKADLAESLLKEYKKPGIYEFAQNASLQEKDGYTNRDKGYANLRPIKPRIEETLEFMKRMGYKKIGLAFCMGLRKEAKIVASLFTDHHLTVVSAICKIGSVPKEAIGITDDDKISPGSFEAMCNPIMQARILNEASTEFNVLLGLCVGHDSLFLKYAEAPCTVLAVKDRVTGHNPLAAVYTLGSYYRSL